MTADEIWQAVVVAQGPVDDRPDFRFSRTFYSNAYPDIAAAGLDPDAHFQTNGRQEGRLSNQYRKVRSESADLDQRLLRILTDPHIRALIDQNDPEAFELFFEIVALGAPYDAKVSDFSHSHYLNSYRDLAAAKVDPFLHYLMHGQSEMRRTLRDLRRNHHRGDRPYDPSLPNYLICIHECSKTGAPIVGRDLVRLASSHANVAVLALRGGELLDDLRKYAVDVCISAHPMADIDHFDSAALRAPTLAILNSVECLPFIPILVEKNTPFVSYLHEYSEYTLPAFKATFTALFADLLVFSSRHVRDSWQNTFAEVGFDLDRDSIIVPQKEFVLGAVDALSYQEARDHISHLLGIDLKDRKLVLGAGHVHWRKGTDLFVLTSQIAKNEDPDTVFVWIGDGRSHEDIHFGVWLDKHIREAHATPGPRNLFVISAGPAYLDLCRAADVFFLSSRLDPLPNVIFDAAEHGCRTVMFHDASGFDDPMYLDSGALQVVEYGNIAAASAAILASPKKQTVRTIKAKPATDFNILKLIVSALENRLRQQRHFVLGGGSYDVTVMTSDRASEAGLRVKEREKIWSFGRRFVWQNLQEAKHELSLSTNWVHKQCRIERFAGRGDDPPPQFSAHIHAYYTDELGGDLLHYKALRHADRIVITTDSASKAREIRHLGRDAGYDLETVVMPNIGRDILPFLRLFSQGLAKPLGNWLHIHQKRSVGTARQGDVWKKFLLATLLGDHQMESSALDLIADTSVGLVAPFDPYRVGWSGARRMLPEFAARLAGPLPDQPIVFPVGNMFFVKAPVVSAMNALFGEDYAWPNEPLPSDGTEFHLIERLWPTMAASRNLTSVFLDKPDQQRS